MVSDKWAVVAGCRTHKNWTTDDYRDHAKDYDDDAKCAETLAILDYLDAMVALKGGCTMTSANTNIAPLSRNGDSASGNPAPATQTPGAHYLYAGKPSWQGTVASNLASAAYITARDREAAYEADRKAMALQRCLIRAKHIILACVLFWLGVAWIWAAPEAVPLLSGAGFETCTNGNC